MNQITTQYVTENGACYEQYVITDPAAKTALTITPERGGMITGFTPAAATRTTACISLTARPILWSATALQTSAPGKWRASARTA